MQPTVAIASYFSMSTICSLFNPSTWLSSLPFSGHQLMHPIDTAMRVPRGFSATPFESMTAACTCL